MSATWDAIVIGSGFGGSVAALRLAEKGYRVAVLEQGRRISSDDMTAAAKSPRRLLWAPALGWDGFFSQVVLRHLTAVRGVGVGGGSIVYAAVLLRPSEGFYREPAWSGTRLDWRQELAPHFDEAERMLGVETCPWHGRMDDWLLETARRMGAEDSFGPTPLGIYFGERGVTRDDPYFGGRGPARTGCRLCGECMGGCRYEAKNTLDKNYLYLAERAGAVVLPLHRAEAVEPLVEGGYEVRARGPLTGEPIRPAFRAPIVVLAAGVLGTLELLFRCRDELGTLPALSGRLGRRVRTNSEAIVGVMSDDPDEDLTEGPAISTHFWPDPATHITLNRFPPAFELMKLQAGPLVDGERRLPRALRTLRRLARDGLAWPRRWRAKEWHRRVSPLSVMQNRDNEVALTWGRRALPPLSRGLRSEAVPGKPAAPSYIAEANEAARAFARASGGTPFNNLPESLLGTAVTAHILGGASLGVDASDGVIDAQHEVFGYPGLYVTDGAALPANVGVNPSLTITAMAERCMAAIPPRSQLSSTAKR